MLPTVDEVADMLRTTRRAIYAMVARRQLPGVIRIRRRVLVRADDLLHWLNQKRVSSLWRRAGVERDRGHRPLMRPIVRVIVPRSPSLHVTGVDTLAFGRGRTTAFFTMV